MKLWKTFLQPLISSLEKKIKVFWHEWGISFEEFIMIVGALCCVMIPVLLRIVIAFFGF